MRKILLLLHGFHSSPKSKKSQQMQAYLSLHHPEITFICPQLPCLPEDVWQLLCDLKEQYKDAAIGVIGSSLGGYFATKLAQEFALKTVLINPAVTPYHLLTTYIGDQIQPYTGEKYEINSDYMGKLQALDVESLRFPENIWLLQQEGDEVLDHCHAKIKYAHCKITSEKGGNHSFSGFERFIGEILTFLF
ncbi:hypothetical protein PCNPT3_01515 [Psychromonas sp. CNPT3]|uniref:YqiA/YcfP family alpha/beta fold hydrolase n=1 Tax=Psychromonas sp. CNPT3 TaxID=314282 RepID=UPI00006E953F|nr:YqiA/YcfP family alpha/beta fold hydrolase [Psychromonas sp. CNPT3]AGH80245.1 hypothetical protein PCNPT3_01515 [Psychromonas sp. CNPT3]